VGACVRGFVGVAQNFRRGAREICIMPAFQGVSVSSQSFNSRKDASRPSLTLLRS
jgi:hypothetical protein